MLSNISDTASAMSSIVQQFAVSANENLNPSGSTATEYHQRELRCKAVVLICSHMRRDARYTVTRHARLTSHNNDDGIIANTDLGVVRRHRFSMKNSRNN